MSQFRGYVSRWRFILDRVNGKKVLHLGCIGITEGSVEEKVEAMKKGMVLHAHIRKLASEVYGIDYDADTMRRLHQEGYKEVIYGDVTELEKVELDSGPFDVIVVGDLIEHLSNPSAMLEGVKKFMNGDTRIVITTPNAFGLLHFMRYMFGIYREGDDHVLSFNIFTLENLLKRHGYVIEESWTCYNRPATTLIQKIKYTFGIPFFKMFPKFGGTLCVIAKLSRN